VASPASFGLMTEAQIRQWVEANPTRVNDWDGTGVTPLYVAVFYLKSLALVLWLLDEKGADVNTWLNNDGRTPFHEARSLEIVNALLDRGADPILLNDDHQSPLMYDAYERKVDAMARLLRDPCVRATVDAQDSAGDTAIHTACFRKDETSATCIFHLLLQAGANPTLVANDRMMPLAVLRRVNPTYTTTTLHLPTYTSHLCVVVLPCPAIVTVLSLASLNPIVGGGKVWWRVVEKTEGLWVDAGT